MKKTYSVAPITVIIVVFLVLSFLVTMYGVLTSLVLSPAQTFLAWGLLSMAVIAILSIDNLFYQLFMLVKKRIQIRWARAQRHEELDRLFPGWDWREKRGGVKPLKK